ncbi:MAG: hypothetical protein ABIJ39_01150, partial [Chloroflexota bacterium]
RRLSTISAVIFRLPGKTNNVFWTFSLRLYPVRLTFLISSPFWLNSYVILGLTSTNLQDFYTHVSLFNIDDGSTETLFSGQPGDWQLFGFSPDNRWVVFSAGEVALFSLDSHLLRRTPTEGGFLGWYVIP